MVLSVALPLPPPEAILYDGLPLGAIEAIKAAYGPVVQILDPPKDGFDLTMKINLTKLPLDEGSRVPFSRLLIVLLCCMIKLEDASLYLVYLIVNFNVAQHFQGYCCLAEQYFQTC